MPDIQLPAGQINIKGPQSATGVDRWQSAVSQLTLTGLALTCALSVGIPAGALTLTGHEIITGPLMPTGAVQYTGLAPTVSISNVGTTIAIPAGAQTWTGLAPTARLGDFIIEVPAGQIVIKGPARPQVVIPMVVGGFRYTGLAPGVSIDTPGSVATIPAGQVVLTGHALTVVSSQTIALPAGTLTITGQYVAVAFMTPPTGGIVWQGLALTIPTGGSFTIAIPTGSLRFANATLTPTLVFAFTIDIPAGELDFTGFEPNASTPASIVVQVGALSLAGQALTIDWATGLPVGELISTGYAPHLEIAVGEQGLPVGRLVFQGYAVDVIHANGLVISDVVTIVRSISDVGTIVRSISDVVER
jgi:hypothetical protein